jgi:argininosuccinate lyase
VFDAVDTVKKCLPVFTAMVETMKVLPENMKKAAAAGFINATDCADYLVKKGMPFRDAYTVVGKLVSFCIMTGSTLETLPISEYKSMSDVFDTDVYDAIALETCVAQRSVPGGPAPEAVSEQISKIESFLEERKVEA